MITKLIKGFVRAFKMSLFIFPMIHEVPVFISIISLSLEAGILCNKCTACVMGSH